MTPYDSTEPTSGQEDALLALVDALDAAGIDYMVTGSIAASLYGVPRMTRDSDVVIDADAGAAPALLQALQGSFLVDADRLSDSLSSRRMFNIFREPALVKVDLIPRDRTHDDDVVFARRVDATIEGRRVRVIAAEDLIVSKLLWARSSHSPMQLRDVHEALRLPGLDHGYVSHRVTQLGLTDLLEEARHSRYES